MSGTRQAMFYTSCGGIALVAPVSRPPVADRILHSGQGMPNRPRTEPFARCPALLRKQMVTLIGAPRDAVGGGAAALSLLAMGVVPVMTASESAVELVSAR